MTLLGLLTGDPFAMLEGLQHPAEAPAGLAPANKPVINLDALYGAGPPALPQSAPHSDPFGLGGLSAPVPAGNFGAPQLEGVMPVSC